MRLTNHEIWLAYPCLESLTELALPPKMSLRITALAVMLLNPYRAIERERVKLVNKYGVLDEKTEQFTVDLSGESAADFLSEFGGLLIEEWDGDFVFSKVRMESNGIDENILAPLVGKFIERV